MAQRRKRRTKAEIEAEKLAKAAAKAEEERMLAEGYEKKRARDEEGHFIKDDPSTPENEAWEYVKKEETTVVEETTAVEESTPVVEEPAKSAEPATPKSQPAPYTCRFKRTRARKRGRL